MQGSTKMVPSWSKDWKSEASKFDQPYAYACYIKQLFLLVSSFVLFNPAHKAAAGAYGRGFGYKVCQVLNGFTIYCTIYWMGLQCIDSILFNTIVHTLCWMVLRHRRWQSTSELGTALAHCPFLMLKNKIEKRHKIKTDKNISTSEL